MKHGIYILTILMALLSLPESGYASIPFFAVANDTIRRVVIYFDANEAKVNLSYKNNNQVITFLDSLLLGNLNTKYITALNVETFVSPDGDESYNRSLAARRNDSIKEFLQRYNSDVGVDKIHFFSEGEDWSEFRKLVASDSNLPDREEVLILIASFVTLLPTQRVSGLEPKSKNVPISSVGRFKLICSSKLRISIPNIFISCEKLSQFFTPPTIPFFTTFVP